MPSIKKLQPLFLALLFLCAASAGLGWLWLSVEAQGARLIERVQTIENKQAFDAQYNELTGLVEETQTERDRLQAYILSGEGDTIQLLSRIDSVALAHQVELGTSELSVTEGDGTFDTLQLSFRISGSEANVTRMIKMFETLPYHGKVTSLSLTRQRDEETGERLLNAFISLALTIQDYDQ